MTRTVSRDSDTLPALRRALALCARAADQALPEGLDRPEQLMRAIGAIATANPDIRPLRDATPDTLPEALEQYAAAVSRRHAAETAVAAGLYHLLQRDRAATVAAFLPTALARLAPVYDKAAQALAKAARGLPAGADAIDPRAVLSTGAGDAHRDATAALRTLHTIAAVLPNTPDPETIRGEHLAAYASVPIGLVPTLTTRSGPVDPDKAAVNKVTRDATAAGVDLIDLALIEIARGTFAPLTLALAATPQEYAARVDSIRKAHQTKLLEDTTNAGIKRAMALNR